VTIERDRIADALKNWSPQRRAEAVERIAEAVGRRPMNEELFFDDLVEAAESADLVGSLDVKAAAHRLKRVKQMRRLAEKLIKLAKSDTSLAHSRQWCSGLGASIGEDVQRLSDTLRRAEEQQTWLKEVKEARAGTGRRITRKESLAG
jgi:hypothetical protein